MKMSKAIKCNDKSYETNISIMKAPSCETSIQLVIQEGAFIQDKEKFARRTFSCHNSHHFIVAEAA